MFHTESPTAIKLGLCSSVGLAGYWGLCAGEGPRGLALFTHIQWDQMRWDRVRKHWTVFFFLSCFSCWHQAITWSTLDISAVPGHLSQGSFHMKCSRYQPLQYSIGLNCYNISNSVWPSGTNGTINLGQHWLNAGLLPDSTKPLP